MLKVRIIIGLVVVIIGIAINSEGLAQLSRAESQTDQTLSPYFHVKSAGTGVENFPLKETRAEVDISGVIADVVVTQVYENHGKIPIEADYVFPGSTRASVYGMQMQVGDRKVIAKIKEKEKAKEVFAQAKREGRSASLLQQHRPNVFRMSIANILPGDRIEVELRYTELLVPEQGEYEFVYPMVVGPRFSEKSAQTAPADENWIANPYLAKNEQDQVSEDHESTRFDLSLTLKAGMPIADMRVLSHEVTPKFENRNEGSISLTGALDRDVIVQYRLKGNQIQSGLLVHRGSSPDEENFFLLMSQPPERPTAGIIPPRDYTFILDVSGSMSGFPLDTAKALLTRLVGSLKSADSFNVLFFAGDNYVLSEKPLVAKQENIKLATNAIDHQRGGGGTRLLPAMKRALEMSSEREGSRSIVVITDGFVAVEPEVFDLIRDKLGKSNLYAFGVGSSVNRHLIEGMARIGSGEPFVVTQPDEIQSKVTRFTNYISQPVLTEIEVTFDGFDAYGVEPVSQPDLMAERPLILYGKWKGGTKGKIHVRGVNGSGEFHQQLNFREYLGGSINPALRYLWARARIRELSDYQNLRNSDKRVEEITQLGLTYNLLTQYTSFVAVDEMVRNPDGSANQVKQPLLIPQGVSNSAIGSSVGSTPEPSEWALMLVVGLILMVIVRRHRAQQKKAKT